MNSSSTTLFRANASGSASVWNPVFSWDEPPSSAAEGASVTVEGQHAVVDDNDEVEEQAPYVSDDSSDEGGYAPSINPNQRAKRGQNLSGNSVTSTIRRAPPKKIRIEAGATIRKSLNVVDMDSDDEIIWTMKNEGYKDEPVRDRLIAEGRTVYDHKTIATRYSRMRRLMADHEEKCLDDDFSDYHEQEDIHIEAAVKEAQGQFELDLLAASAKRWSHVSDILKVKLGKHKYTKKTAQARYEALQDGTAIPPLERDPNPVIRIARCIHERQQRVTMARDKTQREKEERQEAIAQKERERREEAERKERKRAELTTRKIVTEKQRHERKIERESKLKIKQEEEETKTERATKRVIDSEMKKKAKEDERAAKKWARDQEKVARLQQIQLEKLHKIQAEADLKLAKLNSMQDENQRRELIRKFMRNAGMATAAPIQTVGFREPEGVMKSPKTLSSAKTPNRDTGTSKSKASSTGKERGKGKGKMPLSSATVDREDDR